MKITALSKSLKIYDPLRGKEVALTPEEQIRQWVLWQMIENLSFPKGLVSVEASALKKRRADIICYRLVGSELLPLLIVECKAKPLAEKAFLQGAGYQTNLQAPFLCLAYPGSIRTFWKENNGFQSVPFLPPYIQLIQRVLG